MSLPLNAPRACHGLLVLLSAACLPPSQLDPSGDDSTGVASTGLPADASTGAADETSTGEPGVCGDGTVDPGEECDDAAGNGDTAACKPDCTLALCGDGLVYADAEECDDGNETDDDECSNSCELPNSCGDGEVQEPEECDDGDDNHRNGACMPDCTAAICGDGIVHSGVEECDDGDDDNNDACTQICAPPTCGDGFTQTVNSELCDDGDMEEGDECNSDCTTAGLWTDTYNGPADNNDSIHGVATDGAGNVIVAGETFDAMQGDDVWVRKYAPDGGILWTQTHHGVTADAGFGVAVNAGDDIFVAGSVFTLNDGLDAWVRRYTPGGSTTWTQTYNGAADEADEARGITIDTAGNVLVAGYTTTVGAQRDVWVRKYSSAGGTLWTRTAGGAGGQDDEGHAVAIDGANNVVVAGFVWSGAGGRDIWVRKYDSGGTELWTETHAGPEGENDEGNGVATDSGGNIIVVGFETVQDAGRDIWVRKYDPDGNELWTQTYNAPQDGGDSARAVAVDGSDQIVVAGSVFRGTQSDNIWVRKYDPDGNELWTSTYNSDGFGSDVAEGVAVDGDDNIAVGGFETRTDLGEFRNAWVRRMLQ